MAKLNSLKGLSCFVQIRPGDIFLCKDYYFEQTEKYRDKYFFVVHVDESEDDVYAFLTTSNNYYYKNVKLSGCYIAYSKPCFYLNSQDKDSEFKFIKDTFIQFDNIADVTLSDLKEKLTSGHLHRFHETSPLQLHNILSCINNSKTIEKYNKIKITPIISKLKDSLFINKK